MFDHLHEALTKFPNWINLKTKPKAVSNKNTPGIQNISELKVDNETEKLS